MNKCDEQFFMWTILHLQIDEKGTLKATEHDKYENNAGSVRACLWAVIEMHITAQDAEPRVARNSIYTSVNSTISIHPK
jgi:hypothetical protein